MHRLLTAAILFVWAGTLQAQPPNPPGAPRPPETQPIIFEIRVPSDAQVEIQGAKTSSTGEARKYRTPAMPFGRTYVYTIRVTFDGKTMSHEMKLSHAGPNLLDLRNALLVGRPPMGKEPAKKPGDAAKPPPADLPQDDPPRPPKDGEKKPETKKPDDKPKPPPADLPPGEPPGKKDEGAAKKDEAKKDEAKKEESKQEEAKKP